MQHFCSHCGKIDPPPTKKCPCNQAFYCSANCQTLHWPLHKRKCPARRRRRKKNPVDDGNARRSVTELQEIWQGRTVEDDIELLHALERDVMSEAAAQTASARKRKEEISPPSSVKKSSIDLPSIAAVVSPPRSPVIVSPPPLSFPPLPVRVAITGPASARLILEHSRVLSLLSATLIFDLPQAIGNSHAPSWNLSLSDQTLRLSSKHDSVGVTLHFDVPVPSNWEASVASRSTVRITLRALSGTHVSRHIEIGSAASGVNAPPSSVAAIACVSCGRSLLCGDAFSAGGDGGKTKKEIRCHPLPGDLWTNAAEYFVCGNTILPGKGVIRPVDGVTRYDDVSLLCLRSDLEVDVKEKEEGGRKNAETKEKLETKFLEFHQPPGWEVGESQIVSCRGCGEALGHADYSLQDDDNDDDDEHLNKKSQKCCPEFVRIMRHRVFLDQRTISYPVYLAREMIRVAESRAIYQTIMAVNGQTDCVILRVLHRNATVSTHEDRKDDNVQFYPILKCLFRSAPYAPILQAYADEVAVQDMMAKWGRSTQGTSNNSQWCCPDPEEGGEGIGVPRRGGPLRASVIIQVSLEEAAIVKSELEKNARWMPPSDDQQEQYDDINDQNVRKVLTGGRGFNWSWLEME
uniref:MYND-type domain-containing protein n=1 Tax=Corethron hystrix TaxID=216773 RepID=A0A7S1FY21_9STRA|mmetsp:Transcript_36465/g.85231  ORF Transcript_36465/g.85231 Transcript_36465/m.85231 type:complete len:632 (+) Transcript_36465:178-2073(+)